MFKVSNCFLLPHEKTYFPCSLVIEQHRTAQAFLFPLSVTVLKRLGWKKSSTSSSTTSSLLPYFSSFLPVGSAPQVEGETRAVVHLAEIDVRQRLCPRTGDGQRVVAPGPAAPAPSRHRAAPSVETASVPVERSTSREPFTIYGSSNTGLAMCAVIELRATANSMATVSRS